MAFDVIHIIYNPNSTGSGEKLAVQLQNELHTKSPQLKVRLHETEYAGHAEMLAATFTKKTKRPLIISSSGDGGYNEVVNGVMRANDEGGHAVAGLLPAGNANDHYCSLHSGKIVDKILAEESQRVDVLTLKARKDNKPYFRYAHSYIGLGLTPKVGKELNKTDLKYFNEVFIVLRVLMHLHPVRLEVRGRQLYFDSLIFSNVPQMSKVLTLSKNASFIDGKFEATIFRRRSRLKLIGTLMHSSVFGHKGSLLRDNYEFKTLKPTLIQADGEIALLDAKSEVTIGIKQKALECII